MVAAIVVGALASYFVSPRYAVASAVAFLISELADYAAYTPLAERTFIGGVIVSNIVGAIVDSILFLWIAGFLAGFDSVAGLVLGKLWVTAAAVPALLLLRHPRKENPLAR